VILTGNHQISFFVILSNGQTKGIATKTKNAAHVDWAWIAAIHSHLIHHLSKMRMLSGLYTSVTKAYMLRRAVKNVRKGHSQASRQK